MQKFKTVFLSLIMVLALALVVGCKKTPKPVATFNDDQAVTIKVGKTVDVLFETNIKEADFEIAVSDDKIIEITCDFQAHKITVKGLLEGTSKITIGDKKNPKLAVKEVTVTKKEEQKDTTPPAFKGLVDGKIEPIKHLQGTQIELIDDKVEAVDDSGGKVVIKVSDLGGYDYNTPGVYTITYEATDPSGNKATATREITVEEALLITLDHALTFGNEFVECTFDDTEAFVNSGSGAQFRFQDKVAVMTKAFYLAEVEAHKAENNDREPIFKYGVVIILDKDRNFVMARIAAGAAFEIDADGIIYYATGQPTDKIKYKDLVWDQNDNLKDVANDIPEGGYILMAPPADANMARRFALRYTIFNKYVKGQCLATDLNVTYPRDEKIEFHDNYQAVIPKPTKLEAPVLELDAHKLVWNKVAGAKGYDLYQDDVKVNTDLITVTEFDLGTLDLAVSPANSEGYKFNVVAVTANVYDASDSDMSNDVMYIKHEIKTLATPELTLDGSLVKWAQVESATDYQVIIKVAETTVFETNVTELEFDLANVTGVSGGARLYVVARGDVATTHESAMQETPVAYFNDTAKYLTYGTFEVKVYVHNHLDYFARRNITAGNEVLLPGLHLVEDIDKAGDLTGIYTEAFSTVVLLDQNNAPKLVRGPLPKVEWNQTDDWYENENYAQNNAQLTDFGSLIASGDKLLIGKNGIKVEILNNSIIGQVDARNALAYIFIKDAVEPLDNGVVWKDAYNTFKDVPTVTFTLNDATSVTTPKLRAPSNLTADTENISWNSVYKADNYQVYVDDVLKETTASTSLSFLDLEMIAKTEPYEVKVVATSANYTESDGAIISVTVNATKLATPDLKQPTPHDFSWDAIEDADNYDVILLVGEEEVVAFNTANTSFTDNDISGFPGDVEIHIIAKSDNPNYNPSDPSGVIALTITNELTLDISGSTVLADKHDYRNYFIRRNISVGKPGVLKNDRLHLIYGIENITEFEKGSIYSESYSVCMVLRPDAGGTTFEAMAGRSVFTHHYTTQKGWVAQTPFMAYQNQLGGLEQEIQAGDYLLIGKNGHTLTVNATAVAARDFLAYLYVTKWTSYPTAPTGIDGYRNQSTTNFEDPKNVTCAIV